VCLRKVIAATHHSGDERVHSRVPQFLLPWMSQDRGMMIVAVGR
jgi:hypothetical protein